MDMPKALSLSLWAEELETLREVGSRLQEALATAGAPPPPPPSPPRQSVRRVTFEDRTDSGGSFHTACEGDSPVAVSSPTFLLTLTSPHGVELELVKRALGRVSQDSFLPVLFFTLRGLTGRCRLTSKGDFAAESFFSAEALIHNWKLGEWEPLVERFQVEVRGRRLALQTDLRFWVSSRINCTLSEIHLRLLHKLLGDFGEVKKKSTSTTNLLLSDTGNYGLANLTGCEVEVVQLFQVGCALPGRLRIEVRDAWSLPSRTRWVASPSLSGRVRPWEDVVAFEHVGEKDTWSGRPLVFEFPYLGTSGDFPTLELVVVSTNGEELTASVPLAPHILVPNKEGTCEWIKLYSKTRGPGRAPPAHLLRVRRSECAHTPAVCAQTTSCR